MRVNIKEARNNNQVIVAVISATVEYADAKAMHAAKAALFQYIPAYANGRGYNSFINTEMDTVSYVVIFNINDLSQRMVEIPD
jgi:hypothetical protein